MPNIVKSSGAKEAAPEQPTEGPKVVTKPENDPALLKGIWIATLLVWPILKWIVALDCVYQMVRMMYHWNTPGSFAGFRFLLHFGIFVALTYFVSLYKPKGL
ncbi:KleE stable inheritance protein [Massilia sp. TSP1-1-2]|uniref:KleE stable inheritance protein n=1 Tax=Massilia sp. TSP1-1-2 TaxID=2804649 RepID=UPI003CED8C97